MTIKFTIANIKDVDFIYSSLLALAKEEGISDRFTQTKQDIVKHLFEEQIAETVIANIDDNPAAIAIFSTTNRNFSVFPKPGLYLHDLYVAQKYRRKGIATQLIGFIKKLAQERGLGRIDFVVLKDNLPAINFYHATEGVKEIDYVKYMRINVGS